jgi:hypothetical protein
MATTAMKSDLHHYSIDAIRCDACQLVKEGYLDRLQPIYTLCNFYANRDWTCVECELERNDFLLRDRLIDLLGCEEWRED